MVLAMAACGQCLLIVNLPLLCVCEIVCWYSYAALILEPEPHQCCSFKNARPSFAAVSLLRFNDFRSFVCL